VTPGASRRFFEREGARLLRYVLNSHPIIIWALDKRGVATLSEGKGLAAIGLKPGEVVGRSIFEMYRGYPDILESTRRALRGEKVHVFSEVGGVSFDSTYYPLRDARGRPDGMFGVATEITELRRARATVGRLEREQREILDAVPAMIFYKDRKNRILWVNQLAAQSRGLKPERMAGRRTEELYPDEAARYFKDDLEVIRSGKPKLGIVERCARDDGSKGWVRTDKIPYRDERGRVVGVIVFAQDITESRVAEEALRRKAELLDLMQSVASAANLAKTSDEALRAGLRRICAVLGWPIGHVYRVAGDRLTPSRLWHQVGRSRRYARFEKTTARTPLVKGVGLPGRVWKLVRPVWSNDVTRDLNFPRAKAARACGITSGLAFPVLVKNEVAAVLEFFTDRPVIPDPELLEVLGNIGTQLGRAIERERADDVLTRSEELLRHLVVGVRDYSLLTLDPQGRIASWNEGAERVYGHRAAEAVGRPLDILYADRDRARGRPRADLAAAASDGRFEHEGWQSRKDGSRFWANVVLTPLRGEWGEPRGFAHVTRDITERKRLEREILEAGAREQARIGQDLHDGLGQNLTGIALLANALKGRLAARGAAEAEQAGRVAEYASAAVQQAKDLSRGLIPPELQAHGLLGGLRALASGARELFDIDCGLRASPGARVADGVAAVHLYRIAQEAVHNAVKHGRARRVAIALQQAGGRTTLTVADDGRGIEPSGRRKSGLGLGIMQYRARMMGAALDVQRGPRGGTVVTCSIPGGES